MIAMGSANGPGIEVVGTSGSGKTYAGTTIAINMVLEGASGSIIDPKSEMGKLKNLDGVIGPVSSFDITDGDGRSGMLDPFLLQKLRGNEPTKAINGVMSVLSLILGSHYEQYKSVIFTSLSEYTKIPGPDPSLYNYIRWLNSTPSTNERDFQRTNLTSELVILSDMPSADLVLGPHDPSALSSIQQLASTDTGLKIITTLGLKLPESKTDTPTDEQRVAQAVMYLICDIIFAAMSNREKKSLPKFLFIDEAWMILQNETVANLVATSIRLGRSFNYVTMLVSQNASELETGGVANNIGAAFVFKASNDENRESSVRMLGGDKSDVSPQMVADLTPGYCYLRDGENRVGRVHIIQPSTKMAQLLDSRAIKGRSRR